MQNKCACYKYLIPAYLQMMLYSLTVFAVVPEYGHTNRTALGVLPRAAQVSVDGLCARILSFPVDSLASSSIQCLMFGLNLF